MVKLSGLMTLLLLAGCGGGVTNSTQSAPSIPESATASGGRPTQEPKGYVLVGDGPVVVMLTSIVSMHDAIVDGPNTTTLPSRFLSAGYSLMSIDLPCQGADNPTDATDSLACWAASIAAGDETLFSDFCVKLSAALDDIGRPVAGIVGISRAGYVAATCGATDPRIRTIALLAPVTDLNFLTEFATAPVPEEFSLKPLYHDLRKKNVLVRIGTTDTRVGTALAVDFAHDIGATLELLDCQGHCSPEDGSTITFFEEAGA